MHAAACAGHTTAGHSGCCPNVACISAWHFRHSAGTPACLAVGAGRECVRSCVRNGIIVSSCGADTCQHGTVLVWDWYNWQLRPLLAAIAGIAGKQSNRVCLHGSSRCRWLQGGSDGGILKRSLCKVLVRIGVRESGLRPPSGRRKRHARCSSKCVRLVGAHRRRRACRRCRSACRRPPSR